MIELIYTSITTTKLSDAEIIDILEKAKINNDQANITGYLYYDGYRFMQIIEGDDETIHDLYNKIEADPRHQNVELLYEQEIEERSFHDWRMGYEPLQPETLHQPMQKIETINAIGDVDQTKSPHFNYGAILFKVFKGSALMP